MRTDGPFLSAQNSLDTCMNFSQPSINSLVVCADHTMDRAKIKLFLAEKTILSKTGASEIIYCLMLCAI